jgi:DNA invertase Pin-like site-specific DNA recombinase
MNNKAIVYVRVSTKEQDQYSPELQLENCRTYAAEGDLKIVREFREAASGWKANARVEFYKMLEFIGDKKIDNLIYAYGDRLSRNTEDYVKLKATGVVLHNAISGMSFSPSDPEHYDQTAAFEHDQVEAKRFSAKNSFRVRTSYNKHVKDGAWPHSLPIGLRRVSEERNGKLLKRIEPDAARDRASLVQQMFQLFAKGSYTRTQITEEMRALGLRSKRGKPLSVSQIEDMLQDPKYTGRQFRWKGELHDWEENCPSLISQELFEAVQDVLESKRRGAVKRGKDYKYKNLLTCDFCGCEVIGDPHGKVLRRTGEKTTYVYYRCTGGRDTAWYREHYHKPKCPLYYGPYHTEEDIDSFFEAAISSLHVDAQTYDWVRSRLGEDLKNLKQYRQGELAALRKELAETETTLSLMAQRAALAKPPLQAEYEREIENLVRRKAETKARIESLETGKEAASLEDIEETLELSKGLKDMYLDASPEKRRRLNKLMFRTVRVTKKGWLPTPDEGDEYLTLEPFYFVWNEPFKSLWEKGFIQQMAEATAGLTKEQGAYKPKLIIKERA